jgi:hypothetical protein
MTRKGPVYAFLDGGLPTYPAPAVRLSAIMGCGSARPQESVLSVAVHPTVDLNSIGELLLCTLGGRYRLLTSPERRFGLPMELTPVTHSWTTMPTSR